jgi:FAD/FMN-containing dehydrogenase
VNRLAGIAQRQSAVVDTAAAPAPSPSRPTTELAGWGYYPRVQGRELRSEDLEGITRDAVLTRGLGRSYGDSSLPPPGQHTVAGSPLADRLLSFDPETGVVRAEAGFALMNLNRLFFARGWFTPVTPARTTSRSAAHGRRRRARQEPSYRRLLRRARARPAHAGGRRAHHRVPDAHERELFRATLGGMGLTGHILEVEFRMAKIVSP